MTKKTKYAQSIEVLDTDMYDLPDEGLILVSCRLYRELEELIEEPDTKENSVQEFMINATTNLIDKYKKQN